MPETIPLYLVAQQVSLMSVTPQTPASSGLLTAGTALDLKALGTFDRMEFRGERGLFEISSTDALVENYQHTKRSFTVTISEIDKNGKASNLLDIFSAFDYLRVAGAATAAGTLGAQGKILVVIGAIADIGSGFVEGRNATTLTLRPCGILPQWAAAPTI